MTTLPVDHQIFSNGIALHYYEWGTQTTQAAPVVLFAHATGFHARCWDATIRRLRFSGRCIAIEFRGHGRSQKAAPYDWSTMSDDLTMFVDALDLVDIVGVGHSMGGYCMTRTCAQRPERFRSLLLVDPVILSPEQYAVRSSSPLTSPSEHPVSRRYNQWRSVKEMVERFRSRRPFSLWKEEVLLDYCQHGLELSRSRTYRLRCPPLVEASIYMGTASETIWDEIASIEQQVVVMRAPSAPPRPDTLDFSNSPTWTELASKFQQGRDEYQPDSTHFIPMQHPARVAQQVERLLASQVSEIHVNS